MILLNSFSILIILLVSLGFINCDYFSSITGLEQLLDLEALYLEYLDSHINEVEKFNKEIERFLDEVELEQFKIQNNTTEYFEDPINAFKAIKRFSVDWRQMEDFTHQLKTLPVYNESTSLLPDNFTLPTEEDLRGASRGLSRLQHFYKLKSEDMADGQLGIKRYNTTLTASDCFVLGQSLYESKDNLYASEWLIEAMHKLADEDEYGVKEDAVASDHKEDDDEFDNEENMDESDYEENNLNELGNDTEQSNTEKTLIDSDPLYPYVTEIQILEFLGAALYNAGNHKLAMIMNNHLLALQPENTYGLQNKGIFENGVKEERRLRVLPKPTGERMIDRLYAQVCSGELQQTPRDKRSLCCRYVTNNVPYYMLGPLKMEQLNLEPFVAFYHQIISDNEIEKIMNAAVDLLERTKVGQTSNPRIAEHRISKGSWLFHKEHSFLKKVSQRLEDITGLSMETGEPLQVANYGIGGHYDPHMDSSLTPDIDYPKWGNRILTAMFFINSVELGGATAFPFLHLAVPPIKNNLLVWHNLHKSGEMDFRTVHAGCPVIKGSKWIANQWFHSIGQEFKRPCDIKSDTDLSKEYENYEE